MFTEVFNIWEEIFFIRNIARARDIIFYCPSGKKLYDKLYVV